MSDGRNFDKELWEICEREQRLLAQELHDTLCQTLVGLSFFTKASLRRLESSRPVELSQLARISEQLDVAIEQARCFMQPQLLAARPASLVSALKELVRTTSTQMACELQADETIALADPQVAQCFYRIARETVGKIVRDAQSSRMIMSLIQDKDQCSMEIACDRPAAATGSLLEGDGFLRRFAAALGLDWEITSTEIRGATLRCTFWSGENRPHDSGQTR